VFKLKYLFLFILISFTIGACNDTPTEYFGELVVKQYFPINDNNKKIWLDPGDYTTKFWYELGDNFFRMRVNFFDLTPEVKFPFPNDLNLETGGSFLIKGRKTKQSWDTKGYLRIRKDVLSSKYRIEDCKTKNGYRGRRRYKEEIVRAEYALKIELLDSRYQAQLAKFYSIQTDNEVRKNAIGVCFRD